MYDNLVGSARHDSTESKIFCMLDKEKFEEIQKSEKIQKAKGQNKKNKNFTLQYAIFTILSFSICCFLKVD